MYSRILIVGGSFDVSGGKPSKVMQQLAENCEKRIPVIEEAIFLNGGLSFHNGGTLAQLKEIIFNEVPNSSCVIWAPNISNDEEKLLGQIKKINPRTILISTKQVRRVGEYTDGDIVGRLLKSHSNLGITFNIENKPFTMTLSDPLGNQYYKGTSIPDLAEALISRVDFLKQMSRVGSKSIGLAPEFEIEPEFINIIHKFGSEFTKYVNAVNPNRLLGNASTRCAKGFPAVRAEDGYYVSRRNVDKENITSKEFVLVSSSENQVEYYGDVKPSVDSPIQIRIFNTYKNIKYLIHGHVYIKNGRPTSHKVPCGYIDEYQQILDIYPDTNTDSLMINLRGHGCLIGVSDLSQFEGIEFIGRPFPESESMEVI